MNLTVCIPSYNEAATLPTIIHAVARQAPLVKQIIVVNDGSTDGTPRVLAELENQWNRHDVELQCIHLLSNQGKGAAIRAAYRESKHPFVLIQDADLELTPDDYPHLVRPIEQGEAHVVFGNRFPNGFPRDLRVLSRIANRIVTVLANRLYGLQLEDQACGYKLLPTALAQSLALTSNGFELCSEMTAKLGRQKIRIANVPVRYAPRRHDQGKKIRWKDGFIAVMTLIRFRL